MLPRQRLALVSWRFFLRIPRKLSAMRRCAAVALLLGGSLISGAAAAEAPPDASPSGVYALPSFRVGVGLDAQLSAPSAARFALDLFAGAHIYLRNKSAAQVMLLPEVGYSWRLDPGTESGHLALLGLGVGAGDELLGVGLYTPRFVVGMLGNKQALGFRHGVSGHFILNLVWAELSHQILVTSEQTVHELLFTIGANPGDGLYWSLRKWR